MSGCRKPLAGLHVLHRLNSQHLTEAAPRVSTPFMPFASLWPQLESLHSFTFRISEACKGISVIPLLLVAMCETTLYEMRLLSKVGPWRDAAFLSREGNGSSVLNTRHWHALFAGPQMARSGR